jgi:hypothetical protein
MKTKQLQQPGGPPAKAQSFAAAFKMVKGLAYFAMGITLIVTLASGYMIYSTQLQAGQRAYFITERGAMIGDLKEKSKEERLYYEIKNHVNIFMHHMFAFDQFNFEDNMEKALDLSGNDGKYLYQVYNEQGTLGDLIKTNAVVKLKTDSIVVNPFADPFEAVFYGKQVIRTSIGDKETEMNAYMQLVEVSRSDRNIHGLMIQNFQKIE